MTPTTTPAQALAQPPGTLFILTAEGAELDLMHPNFGALTAAAMAHSLAQLNRFTGHCYRPYSVAEHSLLVVEICERELGMNPSTLAGANGLLAALLHDAHECVTGDLHTPGKRMVGPGWREWEGFWERHVRRAYALNTAAWQHAQHIKQADLTALATERRDLLPASPTPWAALANTPAVGWVNLRSAEREDMSWRDWQAAFLDKLHELDYARNELAVAAME